MGIVTSLLSARIVNVISPVASLITTLLKTELALEFIKYMTSAEVQEKIFTGVQANPCNTTVDLNAPSFSE